MTELALEAVLAAVTEKVRARLANASAVVGGSEREQFAGHRRGIKNDFGQQQHRCTRRSRRRLLCTGKLDPNSSIHVGWDSVRTYSHKQQPHVAISPVKCLRWPSKRGSTQPQCRSRWRGRAARRVRHVVCMLSARPQRRHVRCIPHRHGVHTDCWQQRVTPTAGRVTSDRGASRARDRGNA